MRANHYCKKEEQLLAASPGTAHQAMLSHHRPHTLCGGGEFFRELESGTHIKDRRLRSAEALRKCLVLNALAAWRTFDLCRAAREDLSAPVSDYLSPAEMLSIRAVSEEERILPQPLQGVEPPEDVRWWVLRLAGLAGFHSCKRRPLPGNEKLRQAWQLLRPTARATEALLKVLHRRQAAGAADRGRAWPSLPIWPDLQAARVANWSPPEQVDSERLSHDSKPA